MKKQIFKTKVLTFLKKNDVDISGKKVRVYNSPRYGLEVRIYGEPFDILNSKRSTRKKPQWTDGNGDTWNALTGIFSRKFSNYTHINEKDFSNTEEELDFILQTIKDNL